MKRSTHSGRVASTVGATVLLLLAMAVAQQAQDGGEEDWPVEFATLPLELYENGEVRVGIQVDAARLPVDGVTHAKGVTLTFYRPDGEPEAVMEADRCVYNRAERTVSSESPVRFQGGSGTLSGTGFVWRADEETIWIKEAVRATFTGMEFPTLPGVGHE